MYSYPDEIINQTDFSSATQKAAIKSAKKLENNMSGGVCLTLVVIMSYFCICLIGAIGDIFLSTVTMISQVEKEAELSMVMGGLISLFLSVVLLSPLRLSIKGWYRRLSRGQVPLTYAFSVFTSFKRYISAVYFCVVRLLILTIAFALLLAPSAILFGITGGIFNAIGSLDEKSGWFFVFAFLLLVIGLFTCFFVAIRFFYVDYIFLSEKTKNPFKAFLMSFKLSGQNKSFLYKAISLAIPYILICAFILPIPFAVPKIQSIFATHSGMILARVNY